MGLDMYLTRKQHFGESEVKVKQKSKQQTITSPRTAVETEVGYWRKANAIHRWFVEKGGGEDDCRPIPVGVADLKELLALCKEVKATARKKKGLVKSGYWAANENRRCVRATIQYSDGELVGFELGEKTTLGNIKQGEWCMIEDPLNHSEEYRQGGDNQHWIVGETVSNASELEQLLPTQAGFFFGDTDYDECYLQDIDDTIEILERVLAEHAELVADGVKEYDIDYEYQASW